jgi:hypothetical protein
VSSSVSCADETAAVADRAKRIKEIKVFGMS